MSTSALLRGERGWQATYQKQFGVKRWKGLLKALQRKPDHVCLVNPFLKEMHREIVLRAGGERDHDTPTLEEDPRIPGGLCYRKAVRGKKGKAKPSPMSVLTKTTESEVASSCVGETDAEAFTVEAGVDEKVLEAQETVTETERRKIASSAFDGIPNDTESSACNRRRRAYSCGAERLNKEGEEHRAHGDSDSQPKNVESQAEVHLTSRGDDPASIPNRRSTRPRRRHFDLPENVLTQYFFDGASALCASDGIEFKGNERVLDLCAAPGGKSLMLACQLFASYFDVVQMKDHDVGKNSELYEADAAGGGSGGGRRRRGRSDSQDSETSTSENEQDISHDSYCLRERANDPTRTPANANHQLPTGAPARRIVTPRSSAKKEQAPAGSGSRVSSSSYYHNEGPLLICNEYSKSRAQRLNTVLQSFLPQELFEDNRVRVTNLDATAPRTLMYQEAPFDLILVDAPCSTDRHLLSDPIEMARWSPKVVTANAHRQLQLLLRSILLLKNGGKLVYSTCALSVKENEGVVEELLRTAKEFSGSELELVDSSFHLPDEEDKFGPLFRAVLVRKSARMGQPPPPPPYLGGGLSTAANTAKARTAVYTRNNNSKSSCSNKPLSNPLSLPPLPSSIAGPGTSSVGSCSGSSANSTKGNAKGITKATIRSGRSSGVESTAA